MISRGGLRFASLESFASEVSFSYFQNSSTAAASTARPSADLASDEHDPLFDITVLHRKPSNGPRGSEEEGELKSTLYKMQEQRRLSEDEAHEHVWRKSSTSQNLVDESFRLFPS